MLSIIIPTYNESERIATSIKTVHGFLSDQGIAHEILVVDNGSNDETVSICEKLQSEENWVRVFSLEKRGPGLAFALGVNESKGENILTLDADLSSSLEFISEAVKLLDHAKVVIGSKSMGVQRRTPTRVFGSYFYISIAQLLFDLSITDYSMGCKAFNRELILPIVSKLDPWTGHVFEICLFCKIQQVHIIEIGVECEDKNPSRFNLGFEALYRFRHLFRTKRLMTSPEFWIRAGS
jgi:glycosyltransferase involved in cell wall biosynthesis